MCQVFCWAQIQKQLQETIETQLATTTRQVQEMENKVTTVTTKINTVQEKLEKKIESVRTIVLYIY